MKIGIDISQLAYKETGVANYLENLVAELIEKDRENEYILFFSSLRGNMNHTKLTVPGNNSKVTIKKFKFPLFFLEIIWNRLHIFPIEWFIGDIDLYITSDWVEPPVRTAKKATILYDLVVFLYPKETAKKIIQTQKKKLAWVKKESSIIFCISGSTARDAKKILGIDENKFRVIYPGVS
ncbi:MAG TPA: glycosyltransferase [Candidatus Levybacteria bacterium]|nr:glycosyltransferase [Candidatus Levybacteria bacterium]